jgi:hypothetical protein
MKITHPLDGEKITSVKSEKEESLSEKQKGLGINQVPITTKPPLSLV